MERITPAERRAQILRKLAEGAAVPPAEAMRNSGRRRTPEKREVLRRLKELAEERGQTPWPANSDSYRPCANRPINSRTWKHRAT